MQRCPHCNNFFRRGGKLQQHIQKIHQAAPAQPPLTKTVESATIKNNPYSLQQCPHCSSLVRTDRLQRHIDKVHPATPPQSPIAKPVAQQKPLMRKDPRPVLNTPHSGATVVDERIDGSHGWHTFRDQGRFGSYPTFDSMDDESMP